MRPKGSGNLAGFYWEVNPMKFFVGIDIGKWKHEAALMDENGRPLGNAFVFGNSAEGFALLFRHLEVCEPAQTIIGMEATGHYWLALFARLVEDGWDVKVINPIQSSALRKMYVRNSKYDRKDAFVIAEVMRFGRYTEAVIPGEDISQLRELSRFRVELVESTGDLKRHIIALVDRLFPEFQECFSTIFGKTPLEILRRFQDPESLAAVDLDFLTDLMEANSRRQLGRKAAENLKAKAAVSVGAQRARGVLGIELAILLRQFDFIRSQIDEIDALIAELMKDRQLLLSVPGIGTTLGAAILGEIGDISRFDTPKKLQAFAGLDPSVFESGAFSAASRHISKRGSPYLRRAFYYSANAARIADPGIRRFYEKLLSRGKAPKKALVAVAAKLCRIVHAVLSRNQPFDPMLTEKLTIPTLQPEMAT